jgi:hypothetical protein
VGSGIAVLALAGGESKVASTKGEEGDHDKKESQLHSHI